MGYDGCIYDYTPEDDVTHINKVYPWNCGKDDVTTTNERNVTCSDCLSRKMVSDFGRHMFTFPRVRFADTNTLSVQLHKGFSEAIEVMDAYDYGESYERIAEEIMDKIQSAETELIILSEKHGIDLSEVKRKVIEKNTQKGYYTRGVET